MITEIEITAAIFKCQTDEDIFYQKISTIAGVQKVITKDNKLYISVLSAQKNQALEDVSELCDIWHTSFNLVP
tara:strand:+ start:1150 stop:1368 length:219 start_codon:yes stop_codon:yes gene_type:complete